MGKRAELDDWAGGIYHDEAAVYLLRYALGGRLAEVGCPWVGERPEGGHWLDAAQMTPEGVMSGAEGRILALARSLLDGTPVDMAEVTTGLDPTGITAVVGAISIACGRRVADPQPAR